MLGLNYHVHLRFMYGNVPHCCTVCWYNPMSEMALVDSPGLFTQWTHEYHEQPRALFIH